MSEEVETETAQYDFDLGFQEKIAATLLRDSVFATRFGDLIIPEYFQNDAVGIVVRITKDFLEVHKSVPHIGLIKMVISDAIAAKKIRPDMKDAVVDFIKSAYRMALPGSSYIEEKVLKFAKHMAMENAIMQSVGALEKGDFDVIEKAFRAAMSVGKKDDGVEYDYWKEIASRTTNREDFVAGRILKEGISSGYSGIDAYLYHGGWGRKELSLMMGAAKSGKTLSLGDFAKNASLEGRNVLYVSLEVSSRIIADRLDAALTNTAIAVLKTDSARVKTLVDAAVARSGEFKMRDFPSGSFTPNQLRQLLESYRNEGIIFDLIVVDYADIMAPNKRSDNHIDNMRSIYIDLRGIAFEFNAAVLTATQTNRAGAKADTALATDVAEDYNKIRTADIVISINATLLELQAGESRLVWVASRNSESGFALRIKQDRSKMQFITSILGKESI
ncbi:MAG: DnaB-like helicase C-terminal domain-containing protein [Undibacterium sp.]